MTCLAMVLLALLPQIHLWIVRGRDWNGAYVSPQGDEPLYSAYVNALIDGRTRRNDPFAARDDSTAAPLPESTFSIQFIPAYAIALPARTLHVSASTAFIVLAGVASLLASISIFWLLNCLVGDNLLASAGTMFVLCLGGAVGTYGVFGTLLDAVIPALTFLRRYEPAAAFPLFFVFQIFVWYALTRKSKLFVRATTMGAGLTMGLLVFSYLYLWTAAAAWLACIGSLWLYLRPTDRWKTLGVLSTIGIITAFALVPYAYLVSHRASTLDEQHTLIATHRADLLRLPEVLGAIVIAGLVIGFFRHKIEHGEPRVIYAGSLALLPLILFNQQIVTGKTMQVFHFELFVTNYSTLVGFLITVTLLWKPFPSRLMMWMGALSLAWGVFAVGLPTRLIFIPEAVAKDLRIPVLVRLRELSKLDGTLVDLHTKGQSSNLVFSPNLAVTVISPTWTSQGTLLDIGGVECGTLSRKERKELFYNHLYYSKVEPEVLREALNGKPDHPTMERYALIVIFGSERVSPALSNNFKPIEPDEIEREVQAYQAYVNSFSRAEALKRPITYAVIPVEDNFDFTNLDRWYERDAGERVGDYTLYRLKSRS